MCVRISFVARGIGVSRRYGGVPLPQKRKAQFFLAPFFNIYYTLFFTTFQVLSFIAVGAMIRIKSQPSKEEI